MDYQNMSKPLNEHEFIIQYVADNPGVSLANLAHFVFDNFPDADGFDWKLRDAIDDIKLCERAGALVLTKGAVDGVTVYYYSLAPGHTIETASAAVEKYIAEQERTMQLEARADCASCDCEETSPLSTALAIYCLFAAIALPVVAGGLLVMILARG